MNAALILSQMAPRPDLLSGEDLPPPPQQERSRRKREAILRAGLALFSERGYESTTVEEVAHRASVAVGGFYQYFRSKRQLLLVLMDRLLEEVSHMNLRFDEARDADPRGTLARIMRDGLTLDWSYAGAHRAWSEAIIQDAELALLDRAIEDWTACLATMMFRMAMSFPGARKDVDVETTARIITVLLWKLAARVSKENEPVVSALTHLIYHALFEDEAPLGKSLFSVPEMAGPEP